MKLTNEEMHEVAGQLVATCWCQKETEHLEMIPELAEAFAKLLFQYIYTISMTSELLNITDDDIPKSHYHEC